MGSQRMRKDRPRMRGWVRGGFAADAQDARRMRENTHGCADGFTMDARRVRKDRLRMRGWIRNGFAADAQDARRMRENTHEYTTGCADGFATDARRMRGCAAEFAEDAQWIYRCSANVHRIFTVHRRLCVYGICVVTRSSCLLLCWQGCSSDKCRPVDQSWPRFRLTSLDLSSLRRRDRHGGVHLSCHPSHLRPARR